MLNSPYPRTSLAMRYAIAAAFVLVAVDASAQVTLDALRRAGYGAARIKQPQANMLVTPATINGVSVNLVVDTGFSGEGIILDRAHARRLGLTSASGKAEGQSASGKTIAIEEGGKGTVALGNAQVQGVPISFGDFRGLRNSGSFQTGTYITREGFLAADGFIGSGFLRTCSAVIDLHNRILYLRPPGAGRRVALGPALTGVGLAAVPFRMAGRNCITEVEINGVSTMLIMDTGAALSLIDFGFAQRVKAAGFDTDMAYRDVAGVQSATLRQAAVSSFKIAGVPVRAPNLQAGKVAIYASSGGKVAGFLGMDILGQNWSIIDFGEQKLYIAKAQ
jgi:predicted aspartyl protease